MSGHGIGSVKQMQQQFLDLNVVKAAASDASVQSPNGGSFTHLSFWQTVKDDVANVFRHFSGKGGSNA